MLGYQHGFHAGNFADIIKHLTLSRLLEYMTQKEKPLFYLETHSGRGVYDIKNFQAQKTGEARNGIEYLWSKKDQLPSVFSTWLNSIQQLNPTGNLQYYPGSPELAIQSLRRQDRLYFSELHTGEYQFLQQLSKRGKRVFYSNEDGTKTLPALLPPPERRGLIFIDPSYEVKTDYKTIPKTLKSVYQRFETGVYCIWYPVLDNRQHKQYIQSLADIGAKDNLRIEFFLTQEHGPGMNGCGLWIINPPWLLADEIAAGLSSLCDIFNPGKSSALVEKIIQ